MNRFLSITNLIWPLFALHTAVLAQSVDLPVVRQKGASLDLSVAQEADHAMQLAREWLRNTPPANTDTQNCALVRLVLENEASATNLMALAATAGLYAQTNQAQALLAACITNYPPKRCDPETLWLLSRAINQDHQGRLLRNSEPLDWRNDFANLLISSLRRAPSEGAYWEPKFPSGVWIICGSVPAGVPIMNLGGTTVLSRQQNASNTLSVAPFPAAPKSLSPESQMTARIRATAYGILALKEIHE